MLQLAQLVLSVVLYQSQKCKPVALFVAFPLKAYDLIHAFPRVATWGFPWLVLIHQFLRQDNQHQKRFLDQAVTSWKKIIWLHTYT